MPYWWYAAYYKACGFFRKICVCFGNFFANFFSQKIAFIVL